MITIRITGPEDEVKEVYEPLRDLFPRPPEASPGRNDGKYQGTFRLYAEVSAKELVATLKR